MHVKTSILLSRSLVFATLLVLVACFTASGQSSRENAAYHNQKGVKYFNHAFYELVPQKKKPEAEQNFDLAVAEFKRAIAKDETFVEAHRNLARLYSIRENHGKAAEHYRKVTALDPMDLDAYVLAALAYLELEQYDLALEQLHTARSYAVDEQVVDTLSGYIEKVERKMSSD